MNKKQLLEAGVAEDVVDAVLALYGKSVTKLQGENETLTTQVSTIQGQLDTANATIARFKGLTPEQVETQIAEHKSAAEKAKVEGEAAVARVRREFALNTALTKAGAKSTKSLRAELDSDALDKLVLNADGETLDGLDKLLEPLRESHGYLFTDGKEPPRIVSGGGGGGNATEEPSTFEAAVLRGARIEAPAAK